jgi:hypothetical protein
MLDQSFSPENFFKIFYHENRKGTFKRELLSNEYLMVHEEVKKLFNLRSSNSISKEDFEEKLKILNDEKRKALEKYFEDLSNECNKKSFQFKMRGFNKYGKTIWVMDSEPASFFAMKQLQYNIFKTFKVKQANRFDIVKQLRILLEDGFPKYLVRIDVKGFYESIPQNILFKRIDENQLLNFQSKKLLKRCIYCYENMKDLMIYKEHHGVPRGIGVSAYLSELYMREIDNKLKTIKDLVYYGRYVDDIVLVFIPESKFYLRDYYNEIQHIVTTDGLALKDGSDGDIDKTLKLDLFSIGIKKEFDFLGYKFVIENSTLKELRLSDNKLKKYENRMRLTVENYNIHSKFNEKRARRLMINRFKFLTGNFHLINNKKRIKSGIYYSNVLMKYNNEKFGEFKHLDNLIKKHLSKLKPHSKLKVDLIKLKKRIIQRFSFNEGFYKRENRFHSFNDGELNEITSAWKD